MCREKPEKWPPEIIQVEWEDSIGVAGWDPYESKCDSLKDENMEHTSVGYLVKKNTIQIPMCAVKKISYLKTGKETN